MVHRAEEPGIVLLHGFSSEAGDLAPFARSLGVRAEFRFPDGPIDLAPRGLRGRAWWPIDGDTRRDPGQGAADLRTFVPEGLAEAREHLERVLADAAVQLGSRPLILGGFSQGAMLACDLVLRTGRPFDGLVLFSGAPIASAEWRPFYEARRGMRVFISHGDGDAELSFSAAESFQAELAAAGWDVTWVPFAGGHEIPLVVWRAFRRWVSREPRSSP